MRAVCGAAVILWVVAGPGRAGAWLQEKGETFLSLSYEVTTPRAALATGALAVDPTPPLYGYASLYVEHGLTERVTLGLDAGRDEGPDTWTGVVFLRLPVLPSDRAHQLAMDVGVGQRRYTQPGPFYPQESRETEAVYRFGLSWGRGFSRPFKGGWMALDAKVEHRAVTGDVASNVDFTLGLNTGERTNGIIQLQTGDYPDSPAYAKLNLGAVRDLTHSLALETSLVFGFHANDRLGAKTGIWWRF